MTYSCPIADLEHILAHAGPAFSSLRGARIFITGGTGFWGIWLLESLSFARTRLGLNFDAHILTRSPANFSKFHAELCLEPWIYLHQGDVRSFTFPSGTFSHVIHAATEASDQMNRAQPEVMLETIADGTKHVLELAVEKKIRRFLLASSGAIYGPFPPGVKRISENHKIPANPKFSESAYADGKRLAESISLRTSQEHGFDYVSARGFAFVGPHLPLDTHFAVGNFIRDALLGGPLQIKSDGTGRRSYLYAADMAAWLWNILAFGKNGNAYNVGSSFDVSIKELAETVARCAGLENAVQVAPTLSPGGGSSVYVPDIQKARAELGLDVWISLEQALERTLVWHRRK